METTEKTTVEKWDKDIVCVHYIPPVETKESILAFIQATCDKSSYGMGDYRACLILVAAFKLHMDKEGLRVYLEKKQAEYTRLEQDETVANDATLSVYVTDVCVMLDTLVAKCRNAGLIP